jgi:importin subunit alpha-1
MFFNQFYYEYFKCNLIINFTGLDKIEFLQSHQNLDIYHKAFDIIEHYFSCEEDTKIAPAVDSQGQQFQFQTPDSSQLPVNSFQF